MQKRANLFLLACAFVALRALAPIASPAAEGGDLEARNERAEEGRWVPSLAITGGATIQEQEGTADSIIFQDMSPDPVPLRGFVDGNDLAVAPFVGGSLEILTPALPIPARPRLFLSGEILPTFAVDRELAFEGDPGCVRGPQPHAPCASDLDAPVTNFAEEAAKGVGTTTTTTVGSLVYGASLGVAFPLRVGRRELRIKPSFGWIRYEVEAEGFVVAAACAPPSQCISTLNPPVQGFLREMTLSASDSQWFDGIGPGLDVEVDAGRFGPLGTSLFLGVRAYRILGDRDFSFGTSQTYSDPVGDDTTAAQFGAEVDPWMYRAHLGIRFLWLGSRE